MIIKFFRQDRLHKKGGGVCAFVKKVLKVTIINELIYTSESNFQQLWMKLQNKKMKTIIICVTYRPPDCPLNCIQDDFRQNYVRALSMNKPIFILYSQPWIYMHQLKQSKLGAAPTHSLRPTRKNS